MNDAVALVSNDAKDDIVEEVNNKKGKSVSILKIS